MDKKTRRHFVDLDLPWLTCISAKKVLRYLSEKEEI